MFGSENKDDIGSLANMRSHKQYQGFSLENNFFMRFILSISKLVNSVFANN